MKKKHNNVATNRICVPLGLIRVETKLFIEYVSKVHINLGPQIRSISITATFIQPQFSEFVFIRQLQQLIYVAYVLDAYQNVCSINSLF